MATSATASQDGDLVNTLDVLQRPRSQGVATLVVGGDLLLLLGNHLGGTARTADNSVDCLFQRIRSNDIAVDASGQQRSFIQHVLQISTAHTGGALGQRRQIRIRPQRLVPGVDLQNCLAALQVWCTHRNLSVKTARAQQRRVENIRTVGRSHDDHTLTITKTIHFHQQLVQGLLTLIMAAAHTGTTLATDGVNLVDEDNARAVFLGLIKQVTDTRGTDTDEHFDEVRTRDGVERHSCLTSDGAGQQGLTGTGRTVEQNTTRNLRAELLVASWVLQEIPNLVELLDSLIGTSNVLERIGRGLLVQQLGAVATKAEHAVLAALHAAEEVHDDEEEDHHRQQEAQGGHQEGILRDLGIELLHALGGSDLVKDLVGRTRWVLGHHLRDVLSTLDLHALLQGEANSLFAIVNLSFRDIALIQLGQGNGRIHLAVFPGIIRQLGNSKEDNQDDAGNGGKPEHLFLVHTVGSLFALYIY